jgi:Na+/H+ antiporter NhaC
MAILDRVYKHTDKEMTWTRAIVVGTIIWVVAIALLAQLPSVIIYKADQYVAEIIEFSGKLPLVNDEGLNSKQVQIVRDLVANGVQITILIGMLVGAYIWQEKKRKRTGSKGVQDVVKGYMPGK